MSSATFSWPDTLDARVLAAFSDGWQAFLADGVTPNPQTKAQYAHERMATILKSYYVQYWGRTSAASAEATAITQADSELTVT